MLEDTRKRGATIMIYLVFGLLIVIFALSFGPQSVGSSQGCRGPASQTQVTISGTEYGMNTWRWALNNMQGGAYPQRAKQALDGLIRREMLAQEAEERGLVISDAVIDEKIKTGELWILGQKVDGKNIYFEDGEFFNYDILMRFVRSQLGLSIGAFKNEQRRELLAAAMEAILASGGQVSKDEAYALWAHAQRTVTFDAVVFDGAAIAKSMKLGEADVDRFLAAHADAVKAKYDADKAQYTGTPPSVRLRRAMVAKPEGKDKPDNGKATLEAARADIIAKKKTFADVDPEGDLGWRPLAATGLPFPELQDAVGKLTAGGEPSPVIETPTGWWLLSVEEKREGDLSFDQVKRDIARGLALEVWSKEAARRAAVAALDAAKTSGKKLDELYEKAPAQEPQQPGMDREQIQRQIEQLRQDLQDPNKSEEEKQQIRQILELFDSGQLGMGETWESEAIPVSWQGVDLNAIPDEPKDKPALPPVDASKDTLPAYEAPKAKVKRVGPMPRSQEDVVDVGASKELMDALFGGALAPGQLGAQVYAISDEPAFAIVQLIEKAEPDPTEFDKSADALLANAKEDRGRQVVSQWLEARCSDLIGKQEIKIANDVLTTRDDEGNTKQFQYGACGNL
jgi:hypothetical protein